MPRHEPRSSAPRHPEPELDLTCVDGGTSGKAVGGGRLDHGRAARTAGAGLGNRRRKPSTFGLHLTAAEALDLGAFDASLVNAPDLVGPVKALAAQLHEPSARIEAALA